MAFYVEFLDACAEGPAFGPGDCYMIKCVARDVGQLFLVYDFFVLLFGKIPGGLVRPDRQN